MNESDQIGQRAALPYEVIHQDIISSGDHRSKELGLVSESLESARPRMPDGIGLHTRVVAL